MSYQNNYQNNQNDGAMGWDEEIVKDSEFVTLPDRENFRYATRQLLH